MGDEKSAEVGPGSEQILNPESIRTRREILAPSDYVSVYHNVNAAPKDMDAVLDSINRSGLEPNRRVELSELQQLLDSERPDWVTELGVSRECRYTYPSLQVSDTIGSANDRYQNRLQTVDGAEQAYDELTRSRPQVLEELAIASPADLGAALRNPVAAREMFPGEVLELKVDPAHCYVAEMDAATKVLYALYSDPQQARAQCADYWGTLVRLDDFRAAYKEVDEASVGQPDAELAEAGLIPQVPGFYLRQGAPDGLSQYYRMPEILVSDPVPSRHIRVLE